MTTNQSVGRSNAPQETATDCGYVCLQAIMFLRILGPSLWCVGFRVERIE